MQVIHRVKGYAQCPTRYFHLDEYADQCGDFALIEAGFTKPLYWDEYGFSPEELERIHSKRVVLLEFEEPNKYLVGDYPEAYYKDFYKILTICPYTAAWQNNKQKVNTWVPVFFPVEERYIRPKVKKTIDILYSGHLYAKELKTDLQEITRFNYSIISNSSDPIVTHKSVSYEEKMDLYAQSKITLVHNIIYKPYIHRIVNIWLSGDYWNNKAFVQIPSPWKFWEIFTKDIHIPQLKSRVFEAAFSRSLILCRKDDFNVIEQFFEPEKEFIYYEPESLSSTISNILANYEKYEKIAERAYNRAIKEYTVKSFVKKYLQSL